MYTLYRSHNGCMLYLLLIIFCVVSYPCFRLFIIITAVYCILRASNVTAQEVLHVQQAGIAIAHYQWWEDSLPVFHARLTGLAYHTRKKKSIQWIFSVGSQENIHCHIHM